jgi:hypothetical protein
MMALPPASRHCWSVIGQKLDFTVFSENCVEGICNFVSGGTCPSRGWCCFGMIARVVLRSVVIS